MIYLSAILMSLGWLDKSYASEVDLRTKDLRRGSLAQQKEEKRPSVVRSRDSFELGDLVPDVDVRLAKSLEAAEWPHSKNDNQLKKKRTFETDSDIAIRGNVTIVPLAEFTTPHVQSEDMPLSLPICLEQPIINIGDYIDVTVVQFLRTKNKSDKDILMATIVNEMLHIEMRPDPLSGAEFSTLDFSSIPPRLMDAFRKLGGTADELHSAVELTKRARPSPIRNPAYGKSEQGKSDFYSPAGKVLLGRRDLSDARQKGVVRKLDLGAHIVPVTPATAEERQAREERQYNVFVYGEKARGKTEEQLAREFKSEFEIFQDYLTYVKRRKAENGVEGADAEASDDDEGEDTSIPQASVTDVENDDAEEDLPVIQTQGGKITKRELEERFEEWVAKKLVHLTVEGYELYFAKETLDLDRLQKDGYSNREAMKDLSRTPIGADGKSMNYHHLTHYDAKTHRTKSIIILITDNLHKSYSGLLHFGSQTFRLPKKRVDRKKFNPAREAFNPAIVKFLDQPQ